MSSHSGTINHDQSEPNKKAIGLSVIATTLILIFIIWGSVLYYRGTSSAEIMRKENNKSMCTSLQDIRQYEKHMLTQNGMDTEKHMKMMPINDAMKSVVAHYQGSL